MTTPSTHREIKKPPLRFDLRELAGAFGDLGTFIPLTVAMALATGLDFGWMLVAAGLMNIATGLLFRLPIPVQPMKAIAAVAIAEGLSSGAVIASGWVMGAALTLIAVTGLLPIIDRLVPRPVVRAIQLGIGIKLTLTAAQWLGPLPMLGSDSILITLMVSTALLIAAIRNWPLILPVFIAGFFLLACHEGSAYAALRLEPPAPTWLLPAGNDWQEGLIYGTLPQLPLTLLNSVLAVCALSSDYFPKQPISTKRMALSVGLMNLVCVGWSGLPMCHGSGGLAAQYRAGARTGGSVIILGSIKVIAGIAFGVSLLPLLQAYPTAILAPLVAFAGLSLAQTAFLKTRPHGWIVVLPAVGVIVLTQTLYGFVIGMLLTAVIPRATRLKMNQTND